VGEIFFKLSKGQRTKAKRELLYMRRMIHFSMFFLFFHVKTLLFRYTCVHKISNSDNNFQKNRTHLPKTLLFLPIFLSKKFHPRSPTSDPQINHPIPFLFFPNPSKLSFSIHLHVSMLILGLLFSFLLFQEKSVSFLYR